MTPHTRRALAGSLALLFIVMACGSAPSGLTPIVPPASTFTPIPTFTPRPTLPPTIPVTATDAPFTSLFVTTIAANVNLRTQPGTLFPVSRVLTENTHLQVFGRSPGGEWLYVKTDEGVYGWLLGWLVKGGHDGGQPPVLQPTDSQLVTGIVVDLAGVPISGIQFAITNGMAPNAPRTDAQTDSSGQFYAYLPKSASGTWNVSYVAVACTSNTMDSHCNCIRYCGAAVPASTLVNLPQSQPLQFTWK